jgi:branched-chain amino acid transport system substrate-binding protein
VKIALVTSVTGAYQPLGEGNVQGATVAVNQANEEGGIDGRQIELVVLDDKTVADQAVVNVNSALGDDDVLVVLGTPDSNGAVAAAPVASRAGMPYISLSSNDTLPAEYDPYIFNVPPDTSGWANPLLEYMQDNGMETLAVAYASDDVFAEGGWKNTISAASDYGVEVVVEEAFKTADTEFSGVIQKVRDAAPDAFLFWGTGAAPVIMTKAFADAGLSTQLFLTGAQASTLWSDAAGAEADGVILNGYNAVIGDFLPESETKAQYDRLAEGMKAEFDTEVAQFTSDAYAGAWLAIDAMRNASELSRDGVRDALEGTSLVTSNGVYEWSDTNHNNTDPSNIAVFTVASGVFTPTPWQEGRFGDIR